jgi:hypothetical protein
MGAGRYGSSSRVRHPFHMLGLWNPSNFATDTNGTFTITNFGLSNGAEPVLARPCSAIPSVPVSVIL